jgi:hypothetical protein
MNATNPNAAPGEYAPASGLPAAARDDVLPAVLALHDLSSPRARMLDSVLSDAGLDLFAIGATSAAWSSCSMTPRISCHPTAARACSGTTGRSWTAAASRASAPPSCLWSSGTSRR